MNMNTTTTATKPAKKSLPTLGNIFNYLEGTILMVELKTGHYYLGKLLSSTSDMNLVLVDVVVRSPRDKFGGCNNYKLLQYYHQTILLSQSSPETQRRPEQSDHCVRSIDRTTERIITDHSSTSTTPTPTTTTDRRSNPNTSGSTSSRITTTHTKSPPPQILPLAQIRGSKIRYVHFIDHTNNNSHGSENKSIHHLVQVGIHRERLAKQQYQRGVRK